MKIEQNIMKFSETGGSTGYIDLARCLSAVNGKAIAQTKRRDGKYIPLGYMIRVRSTIGDAFIESLSNGYPTRNSVVLAGVARDAMLKSAGIPRSNLETYQKELRILFSNGAGTSNQYMPGCLDKGDPSGTSAWGPNTYDYTKLVIADPDGAPDGFSKPLMMQGTQSSADEDWDGDAGFFVVDNWKKFRKSLTPQASTDDSENNVFSWAMQQSDTAADILDVIDDEADEKPYDLDNFSTKTMLTVVGTNVGNPTSATFCAPLGLLKITTTASASWEIEVLGVVEL